jgi:hypothetical protein
MARSRVLRCVSLVGVGAVACLAAGGCAQGLKDDGGRLAAVRSDGAPELVTYNQRQLDLDNETSHTWNTNLRGAVDDLQRAMLFNSPSRLTRYPVNR